MDSQLTQDQHSAAYDWLWDNLGTDSLVEERDNIVAMLEQVAWQEKLY